MHAWGAWIVRLVRGKTPESAMSALSVAFEQMSETRYDAATLASEAQSRFVSENMRRVFLLIYRIVGDVSDAQDLTQEAFIKALQRQDQLKDLDKAAHWLSRIASNTAIDFLRRAGRVSFSELDEMPEPVAVSAMESPEQMVLRTASAPPCCCAMWKTCPPKRSPHVCNAPRRPYARTSPTRA